MGVRVDAARHDEAAGSVDRGVAGQAFTDCRDRLAFDQHVGRERPVRRDDRSALDDEST